MTIKDLKKCREFISQDGALLRELLHPEKENLQLRYSLAHAMVKPSQRTKLHRLKTSEVYFILEGRGKMHIDQEEAEVFPGETIYIPPHAEQYIENTGAQTLEFLCIVDPAWRKENEEILE